MFEGTYATPAYLSRPVLCRFCDCLKPLDEMVTSGQCQECCKARKAAWYQANKAECRRRKSLWRKANPEKTREMRRRYYERTKK